MISTITQKFTSDYERAIQRLQKKAVQFENISGNCRYVVNMNKTLKAKLRELENQLEAQADYHEFRQKSSMVDDLQD